MLLPPDMLRSLRFPAGTGSLANSIHREVRGAIASHPYRARFPVRICELEGRSGHPRLAFSYYAGGFILAE